jgi:hypothetical protein
MHIYKSKIQEYKDAILKSDKTLKWLSSLRLVIFVFTIILIVIFINLRFLPGLFLIIPICLAGFGYVLNRYNQVMYLRQHTAFLQEINEQEVLRLANKFSDFPTGQIFQDPEHAYVADLDIFGSHSLFQLINRATTESGRILLAAWLSESVPKDVILQRQQAIRELAPKLDWRQDFQASGMHHNNAKSDYNKFLTWIEKPVRLLPKQSKYLTFSILLAVLATGAVLNFYVDLFRALYLNQPFSLVGLLVLLPILVINRQVLKSIRPIAEDMIDNTNHNIKILGGYESLIAKIESEQFHSEYLLRLQSTFSENDYSAVKEINKLKKILSAFQQRGTKGSIGRNEFYTLLNNFWLLDVYWIIMTEKWIQKNQFRLRVWASAVSEFEVLSSVAGLSYSNPSFTFPEIIEEPYSIHFEMLGHPLILAERRVSNDFKLDGRGEIAMITGSNMAGKSTFLRTVGMNLVLALMGAPCCARSGQVSNMKVFSSMRTQDNLEEGVSSFYAELKKIQQLLTLLESGEPIFFLLDEMFKGTNSEDRYKGGVSLIKQLNELNAFGIISTHDLELARLAGNHLIVANFSFNSKINEGEMIFNYTLTEGICTDFNASELMRKSGIRILSDIGKM